LRWQFDADMVRKEASKPDGVIPPGWEPTSQTDLASGQFNLLSLAESEMDRQGPNPAILGRQGMDASGSAQQVRQQAGMSEDAVIYKGIHNWELRVYRAMWDRCRQFWQAPDYIRITDDQGSPQFIGINQPNGAQIVQGPDGPMIQPVIDNALAELDVDIVLDTVPDTAVLAQEQFQTLSELAQMYGPQEVPFDDLLQLSTIADKSKLIAQRKQRKDQMAQQQAQAQQLGQAGAVADINKTTAQANQAAATADKIATETAFTRAQLAYWGQVVPMPMPQPMQPPPPDQFGASGLPAAGV
jgi:hypothetical protein